MTTNIHKWIPNSILCNTIYKCKKTTISSNYVQRLCSWEGTLIEYIQHIKKEHHTCFFILPNEPQKFEWKLPFIGDQTDVGIFHHNLGHFLYEIFYKESSGEIYFSLAYLGFDNLKIGYEIFLSNDNGTKKTFACEIHIESKEILKSIYMQKHKIIIAKDIVLQNLYSKRVFQWHVAINLSPEGAGVPQTLLLD